MEILNLAASALFESLTRNNFDQSQLIEGTQLKLEDLIKTKKTHSWDEFLKMYENCAHLLGPNKAAREIAYYGIYNENVSVLRKVATGFFNARTLYWYAATFASKIMYRGAVSIKYSKITDNHVVMEIGIHPELKDCPLLLETYIYFFEFAPTVLGLPKAVVKGEITDHRAVYNIYLPRTSFFGQVITLIKGYLSGYRSSIVLLSEMEDQSVELSNLLEEKSQLLRILSHDISNQVSIIETSLQRVLKSKQLSEEDRKYLQITHKSSQKLYGILKDVRNLEKSHLKGINLSPVDLDLVFESVKNHFKEQLANKKITLKCENRLPTNITALAEKNSLEINVLGNLISNAIKFSHEGSIIEMDARFFNGKVHIHVNDQGVGISPEMRDFLFSKRTSNSSIGTKGETGIGFGLGIVKNYVNLYKGNISVHPNIPCGTTFVIELLPTTPQFFEDFKKIHNSTSE